MPPSRPSGYLPERFWLLVLGCCLSSLFLSSRLAMSFVSFDADSQNLPSDVTTKASQATIDALNNTTAKPPLTIRECSSPEANVDWPFQGTIIASSDDATHTCGLQNNNKNNNNTHPFVKFLSDWVQKDKSQDCDTVVYGVAFGTQFVTLMTSKVLINYKERFQRHDKCFFTIVLEEDLKEFQFANEQAQFLGVPRHVLPYKNLRRNVKLFKFSGHLIFPNAKKIIWQDAKFFKSSFIWKQPQDYSSLGEGTKSDTEGDNKKACLVATSMPHHPSAYGMENFKTVGYRPKFRDHCATILSSLQKRPNVTDSTKNLMHQCNLYMNTVGKNDTILDDGLLDSAFLIWNYDTAECRNFNAKLQCTILDQIHCYSDRDQVSIPMAFSLMDLVAQNRTDTRKHDFQFVEKGNPTTSSSMPRIHMTRSACHWYFSRVGECRSSLPSVAVMVAGTAHRFLLNSTLHHLLDAAAGITYQMDYFAYLTTSSQATMDRQDDYAANKLAVYDPIFKKDYPSGTDILRTLTHQLGLRNIYRDIIVRQDPANITNPLFKEKLGQARYLKEDKDNWFPALVDVGLGSNNNSNNMLKLFNHIEILWNEHVLPVETMLGKPYDYVLILRDDVLWLEDFNLTAVTLYQQNSEVDAYMLSCDARNPPMSPWEVNDDAILVRRSKAGIFGNYLSTILQTDMAACHAAAAKVQNEVGENHRGCTSEMVLKHIIESNNVTFQLIPQALIPLERSLTVRNKNKKIRLCFRKMCQSKDDPLVIPEKMRPCDQIIS